LLVRPQGGKLQCKASNQCMKVHWSMVVKSELSSLSECLLVCNLVVREQMAAITGDNYITIVHLMKCLPFDEMLLR
jgi:hypothetical protein